MESMENYRKIITSSRDGWSPYTVDTDSTLLPKTNICKKKNKNKKIKSYYRVRSCYIIGEQTLTLLSRIIVIIKFNVRAVVLWKILKILLRNKHWL